MNYIMSRALACRHGPPSPGYVCMREIHSDPPSVNMLIFHILDSSHRFTLYDSQVHRRQKMAILKPVLRASALGIALLLGTTAAQANDYPNRAITVVVPFLAGGGGDTLARIATNGLAKELGQSIVVENK